jgi:hypothetical protein
MRSQWKGRDIGSSFVACGTPCKCDIARHEFSRSSSYLERHRAPTASDISRTMASKPRFWMAAAVASPAGPAPTTMAS